MYGEVSFWEEFWTEVNYYWWVVIAVYGLICGSLSGTVARYKRYDFTSWFFAGFLFGLLGLIASAGLPIKPQEMIEAEEARKAKEKADWNS